MAELLAGQIIRAADLNYPVVLTQPLLGGPTSGATELVLATLVVPAQPIAVSLVASFQPHGNFANLGAGGRFIFRIRETNVTGTVRSVQDMGTITTVGTRSGPYGHSEPIVVPANTAMTLVATVQRFTGAGDFTASGSGEFGRLSATLNPDRT